FCAVFLLGGICAWLEIPPAPVQKRLMSGIVCSGLCFLFAWIVTATLFELGDRLMHSRRLVLKEDRLEIHDDRHQTCEMILFRNLVEIKMRQIDNWSGLLILSHSGKQTYVDGRMLYEVGDFETIRDWIVAGCERQRQVLNGLGARG